MCITCTSTPDNITSDGLKIVLVKNYTKATIQLYKNSTLASFEDEEGQRVVSSIEPGNKVEIIVVFGNGFIVKKTTVYLIYDELIREKMEQLETQEELAIVSDGDENECSVRGSSPQVELVDEKDIVFSGDDNEGIVRTSSPQVERMDVNGAGGAASCCGLVKYSFRQWITDFMCRLVQCWEEEEALSYIRRHLLGEDTKSLRLHDVFLSFRGEDTRASFTSHLYDSLQNDGIKVFMDDGLQRGDHIQFSINIAIEVSQIAVIVFSKNYANSRWCLDELVNIIQVRRTIGQVVLPVFYDVDPSEVRHQIGEFGKAFQSLLNRISKEEEDKSLKWRDCLHEAASIAGFVVLNSRNEREAINHIVEKVALLLDKTDLFVADNPVGIESRVQDTIQLLNIQPEIVREQSPKEPGERSRLWFNVDVLDVLSEQTGTQAVEGLALKFLKADVSRFSTKSFEKMNKLRLLQLAGVQLDGDFDYLSRKLRWLCWNGFPLTCIPTNLYRRNLVSMELENSNIKLVWKENQRMEKLKVLNLSHSHYLTQTPDFAYLPNLEKLVLADCPRLSEISHSIGDLKKILLISLEDCISLRSLPRSIYKLKTLKTLNISGCLMIDKLEEDLEQMESLTILMANKTSITSVPFSVVRSKSIGYISLCGHEGFSCDVFPSIIWSWMSPTNNLPSPFQTSNIMSSLVPLDVPHSSSHELSSISMYLPSLRSLWIECSSELQLSQDAAIILDALYATNSKEMEPTATASASQASNMVTSTSQVSKHSSKSLLIQIGMNGQVTNILKEIILQNLDVNGSGGCFLPGDSYPNWLTFSSEGSFVTFQVPRVEGRNLKTIITTRK
ncbi:disease resistance protein RPV1 [Trifolium repens]|nr:disease resistance protein RPV1 [Trifolium repens]